MCILSHQAIMAFEKQYHVVSHHPEDFLMRLFSLLMLFSVSATVAAASPSALAQPPGKYAVGLQVVQQYDHSRSSLPVIDIDTGKMRSGELARPMQTLVWYPADNGGKTVTYGDYVRTVATGTDFSLSEAAVTQATQAMIDRVGKKLSPAQRLAQAARPMLARRDAGAATGKFPLVIYAPGANGHAHDNAALCEYLASQGYVVMASASIGNRGRAMETTLEGLEAQAADIGFLIAYAHKLPQVDTARIAVAGFSWGGLANVLAAAKDQRIRALVALDGSMRGYPQYINSGKDAAKYVTPARVAVPLLYLSARPKTIEEMEGDYDLSFSFINAMKYADVYYFTLHPLVHGQFAAAWLPLRSDADFGEYSRQEVMQATSWGARYVLEFLNAYLKQDAKGRAFLGAAPASHGVPAHMITADVRPASRPVPSLEALSVTLHAKGFAQAIPEYEAGKLAGAPLLASENDLNQWGYRFLRAGRPRDGLEILKLLAHLYPDSGNAHDSVAEAYAINNDNANAIVHYQRALQLDPKNTNAAQALAALKGTKAAAQ
jgi:dienelactone hydrolase